MRSCALLALVLIACGHDRITREIGARCAVQNDCDDRCLVDAEYPDGLCSITCTDNRDCTDDTVCSDREGGVCLFECVEDIDCEFLGAGWSCHDDELHEDPGTKVNTCRGE